MIPKELQGKEVQKFENAINFIVEIDGDNDPFELVKDIIHVYGYNESLKILYTQPFKPETIEKYFEKNGSMHFSVYKGEYWGSMKRSTSIFITLSDFIDACLNSDIKLRWKK